jgi:hypothetical protein
MLNISTINFQLTNVTYNFGNMEADNVEHLCNFGPAHKCIILGTWKPTMWGQFTNITFNFGNMKADNVGAVHKCYL